MSTEQCNYKNEVWEVAGCKFPWFGPKFGCIKFLPVKIWLIIKFLPTTKLLVFFDLTHQRKLWGPCRCVNNIGMEPMWSASTYLRFSKHYKILFGHNVSDTWWICLFVLMFQCTSVLLIILGNRNSEVVSSVGARSISNWIRYTKQNPSAIYLGQNLPSLPELHTTF